MASGGESDTRNYYDMIAGRQELELRPALERLDRVIAASEGIDPGALDFAFRPLWQLDAATAATIALQKAQATQVYAGLNLWPTATTARLVEAQLAEDGTYPNARAVFGEGGAAVGDALGVRDLAGWPTALNYLQELRELNGRWTTGEGTGSAAPGIVPVALKAGGSPEVGSPGPSKVSAPSPNGLILAQEVDPDEESRRPGEPGEPQPGDVLRVQRFNAALEALRAVDPNNQKLESLQPPDYIPTEADITRVETAAREASIARTCDFLLPNGRPIGEEGTSPDIRLLPGGFAAAQRDFDYLKAGGTAVPFVKGSMVRMPYGAGTITLRPITSTPGSPAVGVSIPGYEYYKLHY